MSLDFLVMTFTLADLFLILQEVVVDAHIVFLYLVDLQL